MFIRLNSIQDVKDFVTVTSSFKENLELHSGIYIVDAKSIMGVLSLDLSQPVNLVGANELKDEEKEKLERFETKEVRIMN